MPDRLTLVFDADDTLWENNVLFERAFAAFQAWLAHPTLDDTGIRRVLNEVERATVVTHGYGTRSFLHALQVVFERLRDRTATIEEVAEIQGFGAAMLRGDLELVPGVVETLTELGGRHDLLMLTKGDPDEQQRKIDASTLAAALPQHPHRPRQARRHLPAPCRRAGARPRPYLDDRQLPALGHPPGPSGRHERGVHPERLHVGAGDRRATRTTTAYCTSPR